ncbi:MAG: hypothetical protein AAF288_04105 [Planctomycetota bacterium]
MVTPEPPRWSPADLADAVHQGLQERAQADDLEQAVYSLDALDELGLHPLLTDALDAAGYGVHREQRYPGHAHKRKKSHGLRCDLVLTPRHAPLQDPRAAATLFEDPRACPIDHACWVEVKTVAQYETSGAFRRYSAELLQTVSKDIRKLWSDGVIRHAALLIVLFSASQRVAEHDLLAWQDRCLRKGMPVSMPALRGFALNNRLGNAWCATAVFTVRGM